MSMKSTYFLFVRYLLHTWQRKGIWLWERLWSVTDSLSQSLWCSSHIGNIALTAALTSVTFSPPHFSLFLCTLLHMLHYCRYLLLCRCTAHQSSLHVCLTFLYTVQLCNQITSNFFQICERELLLTGYFLFFGPFSVNPRDGCVGKSQRISSFWITHQQPATFIPRSHSDARFEL